MRCVSIILLCLFALCSRPALADTDTIGEWAYDYFIDGATLKLGVGTRQTGIRVLRLADDAEGKIVQRDESSYFLQYSTSPIYFSIDKAGLTFIFNVSGFNANQQEVARDTFVDLGSRASGQFFYVVPTAFYEWGDYKTGKYTRVGIGIGAGVARFNGDVILTSTPGNDVVTLEQTGSSVTAATSFIIESHWHHWGLTFHYAGPVYNEDAYQFTVEDLSVSLGYQFVF